MPALLPLEGDPSVVAARAKRAEHAGGAELTPPRQPRHPAAPAFVRRLARHVFEVHVPDAVAQHGQPVRGRFSHLERVRGIQERPRPPRGPRAGRSACRAPARSRRATRSRPRRRAGAPSRRGGPAPPRSSPRRRAVLSFLNAVAEHPDARRAGVRPARSTSALERGRARGRLRMMEERARVDAGDLEPGIAQARDRLAQARAVSSAAHSASSFSGSAAPRRRSPAAGGVDHGGQRPGRSGQGRAEPHVILLSMDGVTRLRTGRPRKKRSRSSSTIVAIAGGPRAGRRRRGGEDRATRPAEDARRQRSSGSVTSARGSAPRGPRA